jgi:predicted O-methyltransferase YrrM
MARKSLAERLVRRFYYKYYARNLLFELQDRARRESADYVQQHMAEAVLYETWDRFLQMCVQRAPAGAVLEFGVAGGTSIRQIAAWAKGTVYGFDSFVGLPDAWSGHVEAEGAFSQRGVLPKVPANVKLYKGWFEETIPLWLSETSDPIGFLHVDCDIYASTRSVLLGVRRRLQNGTIIKFDEYFNYPNWQAHEFRAWQEFVAEFAVQYRYLAFTASGSAVAVRITDLGSAHSE